MSALNKLIAGLLPEPWRRPARDKKRKVDDFLNGLLFRAVRALPDKSQVYLKSRINVIRPMDYARHRILLNIDSPVEYRVRVRSSRKEPETVQWIETSLRPGDVLYDVGANIGAYSLVAAKYFGNQVKVYAFEPSFVNFGQLCKNIKLNGSGESVIPMSVALSDRTVIGDFHYHDLMAGGALNSFGEAVNDKGERFEATLKHALFSFRADDLVKMFGIPPPTHIKIDVDGLEMAVLRGAEACLARPEARSVIIEVGRPEQADEVRRFLERLGFQPMSGHARGRQGTVNYIFSRPG